MKDETDIIWKDVTVGIRFRNQEQTIFISYLERVKILKKWLIICSVFILCFIGLVAGAYFKALQPKNKAADIAFETVKAEADMKTMDEFYLYRGLESYSVVIGSTNGGQKKIVWIPDNDRKEIVVMNAASGKSKEDILSLVQQKISSEKVISVKLGMENSVPLWEVTYQNSSGKYNYDYYDFKTGEWLKYYRSI